MALVVLALLGCGGCTWQVCRTSVVDPHLLNPAAPSQPAGTKCESS